MRLMLVLGLLLALASPAIAAPPSGQSPQPALSRGGYAFQLFLPRAYSSDRKAPRWPLMIFLHGSGERGSDLNLVKVHGPPKKADGDPDFPFVLISPQLPADSESWGIAELDALLDHAMKTLNVDPDRILLTGLSLGGHGTWEWAEREPGRFAAIAPVAGRGDPAGACSIKDLPTWAFHGDRDDVVDPRGSFEMQRAIRACGGNAHLTVYPDWGHNSWDPAYDDPALYYWLLRQRRPQKP